MKASTMSENGKHDRTIVCRWRDFILDIYKSFALSFIVVVNSHPMLSQHIFITSVYAVCMLYCTLVWFIVLFLFCSRTLNRLIYIRQARQHFPTLWQAFIVCTVIVHTIMIIVLLPLLGNQLNCYFKKRMSLHRNCLL